MSFNKKLITTKVLLTALFAISILGCGRPLTSPLFMQTKRVNLLMPTDEEGKKNSTILSEKVEYKQKIDTIKSINDNQKPKDNTSNIKSKALQEVTVTSNRPKIKITNIRNGHITLNFLLSVPSIFNNDNYRIILTPSIINGDSTEMLAPVVLIGSNFRKKQEEEHKKLLKLDSMSVDKNKYDNVFFDKKKHRKFMYSIQSRYLNEYIKNYDTMMDYMRWYNIMQDRYSYFNSLTKGEFKKKMNDKALVALSNIYKAKTYGKDTTKYHDQYIKYSNGALSDSLSNAYKREITESIVPAKFAKFFSKIPSLDSLKNLSTTEIDSQRISKHTYDYIAIEKNERYQKDRSFIIESMPFKKIENAKEYILVKPNEHINYLYSQDIPVTETLSKKLKVILSTKIMATDKSTWNQNCVDTLSFVVTGLNDLADTTLLNSYKYKEEYYNNYKAGLDRLKVRDYAGALTILRFFPDYNAAICLVGLGMNDKALELLNKIEPTGKSLYLKSIVLVRLNKLEEAKEALTEACKRESFLGYKADIEPELSKILKDQDFRQKIQDIADGL